MNVYEITNQLKPNKPLIPLDINKVFFIIIHHTGSNADYTWRQCNLDHKARGYNCCGYNEMIYPNGDAYICRGLSIGAQAENMNSKSYGISVVGNYDKDKVMPDEQINSLVERIKFNKKRFPNKIEVVPHSRFYNTSCPGRHFPLTSIINSVNTASFADVVQKFVTKGIIQSPEYWLQNCTDGKTVDGRYVRKLLENMASKF